MTRAAHNCIVVAVLLALLVFTGVSAAAQDTDAQAAQPTATVATTDDSDDDVTDLPSTGRGHEDGDGVFAVDQMVITLLVLLATAALALGGIGLFWRYDRR